MQNKVLNIKIKHYLTSKTLKVIFTFVASQFSVSLEAAPTLGLHLAARVRKTHINQTRDKETTFPVLTPKLLFQMEQHL